MSFCIVYEIVLNYKFLTSKTSDEAILPYTIQNRDNLNIWYPKTRFQGGSAGDRGSVELGETGGYWERGGLRGDTGLRGDRGPGETGFLGLKA